MGVFTVGCDAVAEFVEKKSVFRSYSFFVTEEKQAIEKIRQVQEWNNQATHNVYAYCLREHGIERFSDAGEPQGTAGMPVLKVIHLNDSKNVRGARKDRHANVGHGEIGFDSLYRFFADPRLEAVVKILETPYVDDHAPYGLEIEMLRSGAFDAQKLDCLKTVK